MKVILRRDVKGLGHEGDLKEVRDGYARNLLLPSGAATLADSGALKNWERHRGEGGREESTLRLGDESRDRRAAGERGNRDRPPSDRGARTDQDRGRAPRHREPPPRHRGPGRRHGRATAL